MDFLSSISTTIQRQQLIQPGDLLVLGVSGGPDSLAMLYALHTLRCSFDCQLHVAHLDHQLRPESAEEASFVAEQATCLGLAYTIFQLDIAAEARRQHLNEYAAGRIARYRIFSELATQLGAASVAVAHTADDQAETVLLHLLRGAGTEGLAAMSISTAWEQWATAAVKGQAALIRPLLHSSRAQVEAYCTALNLQPRRDPANQDTRHMRSRIRHQLLPQLIEYNPRIVEALCRTATICGEDQAFLQTQLDQYWHELVDRQASALAFKGTIWQDMPLALQRAALRRAHSLLTNAGKTLELSQIDEVCRLVAGGVGRQTVLPGAVQLVVGYDQDFVLGKAEPLMGPQLAQESYLLELPATLDVAGWTLYATLEAQAQEAQDSWEIWLDAQTLAGQTLMLRRRRPADRIRPAGGSGSRSIQDLMVDAKLPRELRPAWPLLIAGERIVWVPGLRAAEGVSCAAGQGPAVWLRLKAIRP